MSESLKTHNIYLDHVDYVVSKEIFLHVSLLVHTVVHGFVNGTYDVVEGESLDTIFQLNVKGETRFSSAQEQSLQWRVIVQVSLITITD